MTPIFLAALFAAATAAPVSAPAAGPTPAATVAPAKVKAAPKDSDIICWSEKPAGSHIAVRQCARRDDLERRTLQDQDMLDRAHTRNGSPGSANVGEGGH